MMELETSSQQKQLRLAGIVAILAALAAIVADISLQYSPTGRYGTFLEFQGIPEWRILLGHYLGIFVIPLSAVGYWQVAQALKPAGKWFSLPVFLLAAYSMTYGTAFHGSFATIELIVQARQGASIETQSVLTHLLDMSLMFSKPLALVFLLNYLTGCSWYVIAVIFKHTLFPKWMALFNPFLLSMVITFFYLSNLVPMLGNLLFPAVLSLPHAVFFTLSTVLLWNGRRETGEIPVLKSREQVSAFLSSPNQS